MQRRNQNIDFHRLGKVGIATFTEATNTIYILGSPGQHHNADVWQLGSQPTSHAKPITIGQPNIQQDDIWIVASHRSFHLGGMSNRQNFKAELAQPGYQHSVA